MQIGDNRAGRYAKEYLLTDFKCRTHRLHDEYRPRADKYCDYIEATVIAPGREDMLMYEWFINRSTLSGRLLIQLPPKPTATSAVCSACSSWQRRSLSMVSPIKDSKLWLKSINIRNI